MSDLLSPVTFTLRKNGANTEPNEEKIEELEKALEDYLRRRGQAYKVTNV